MQKPELTVLKSLLVEKGLNQSGLARKAECSNTYISRILRDDAPFGSVAQARIIKALEISPDDFAQRVANVTANSPIAEINSDINEGASHMIFDGGLQMVPLDEKNVRLVLNVAMPFVDAVRVYRSIENAIAEVQVNNAG